MQDRRTTLTLNDTWGELTRLTFDERCPESRLPALSISSKELVRPCRIARPLSKPAGFSHCRRRARSHGCAIELHDHGGSSGAVHVVRGALEETSTNRVVRTPLARARVGEGESIVFGPDHVHDVVDSGRQPALSIHVYAPRLVSMTFYDDRPARFLDVVRHETLDGTRSAAGRRVP